MPTTDRDQKKVIEVGAGDATTDSVSAWEAGASADAHALFGEVYDRLKAMVGKQRRSWGDAQTLNTTALVNELYLRVCAGRELRFEHPAQFFSYAARALRHLLSDQARNRLRARGGRVDEG